MLYALDQWGMKISAYSGKAWGKDPFTGSKVIATPKHFRFNTWELQDTEAEYDLWAFPETTWNLQWKKAFPKLGVENIVSKDKERHIADFYTDKKVTINFQSKILKEEQLLEREAFFEKMIWVIDARNWKLKIHDNPAESYKTNSGAYYYLGKKKGFDWCSYKWSHPKWDLEKCKMPVFLDIGDDCIYWLNWSLFDPKKPEFDWKDSIMPYCEKQHFVDRYS